MGLASLNECEFCHPEGYCELREEHPEIKEPCKFANEEGFCKAKPEDLVCSDCGEKDCDCEG